MRENLSTTVSVTSTYAGEFAGKYIQAALLAGYTLGNNTITIKPNIKYKEIVKKLATSATIVAAATCDFTPTATVTLTEKLLTPVELQVNLQLCKLDFKSDWEAIEMGYSAFDVIPKNFSDFLIANLNQTVGANLETAIWQGGAGTDTFSGFTTLFKLDSGIVDVSGTTITSSNVQAELAKVVTAIAGTNVYLNGEKPVIYAGTAVIAAYLVSLGGFGANGVGGNGYKGEGPAGVQNAPMYFAGLKLVEAPGMPANYMVCAQPSNLWFGTGLLNDTNQVKVIDMADLDGSENVRYVMRFTAGIQYGVAAEIVFYWIY